jgi:hypothetical protein
MAGRRGGQGARAARGLDLRCCARAVKVCVVNTKDDAFTQRMTPVD